jgi:hypothetical protein
VNRVDLLVDETRIGELYEHLTEREQLALDFLIAKHKAAEKGRAEKSKCSICGKMFWPGEPMRAHKKARDHYTLGDKMSMYYDDKFLQTITNNQSCLEMSQIGSERTIKFFRYGEEANGQN